MDLAEAAPLVVGRKVCWRRRKGEAGTWVGVRVVVGLQMGKRTERQGERRRDVSDRIGGGVGELDNHQNSPPVFKGESRA